ncbi:MAG TPA: hypothetical protein VFV58_12775 [Blastocatellia bacterium]|jgi:hypothetical protein|nr:hypothetical protein [Blastocatellia bacterium]
MKCNLYSDEELVGWAELISTDPPMGCASGPFYPNDNYRKIQPIIREYHLYDGTLGEVNEQKRIDTQAKIDALRLSVITEDGEVLDPAVGVHLADFSEELDEDPYQLDVIGLSFDIYDRLFPLAWQEYLNLKGKEQD